MCNARDYGMLFMLLNEDYHDLINKVKNHDLQHSIME